MSAKSEHTKIRDLRPGQEFVLTRSGVSYIFLGKRCSYTSSVILKSTGRQTHLSSSSYATVKIKPHIRLKVKL